MELRALPKVFSQYVEALLTKAIFVQFTDPFALPTGQMDFETLALVNGADLAFEAGTAAGALDGLMFGHRHRVSSSLSSQTEKKQEPRFKIRS